VAVWFWVRVWIWVMVTVLVTLLAQPVAKTATIKRADATGPMMSLFFM
jgi:hypothetical protein